MAESDVKSFGRRIGIMGGTFNPIHNGHLLLACAAYSELKLDKVVFMPSGNSYMKDESTIETDENRMKMVELAIEDYPMFITSDMELKREGNTYTSDTLLQLKEEHPQDSFFFICGADCLYTIEKWKDPQIIFDNCTILTVIRNGVEKSRLQKKSDELMERFHGSIYVLAFQETDISSTDIRKQIKEGKNINNLIPEKVKKFIECKHLYIS